MSFYSFVFYKFNLLALLTGVQVLAKATESIKILWFSPVPGLPEGYI